MKLSARVPSFFVEPEVAAAEWPSKKILVRLKHLGRPVGTWMEAFRERKIPVIGDWECIPAHLRRLSGIQSFLPDAVVTDVTATRGLLVIYMSLQPRAPR